MTVMCADWPSMFSVSNSLTSSALSSRPIHFRRNGRNAEFSWYDGVNGADHTHQGVPSSFVSPISNTNRNFSFGPNCVCTVFDGVTSTQTAGPVYSGHGWKFPPLLLLIFIFVALVALLVCSPAATRRGE